MGRLHRRRRSFVGIDSIGSGSWLHTPKAATRIEHTGFALYRWRSISRCRSLDNLEGLGVVEVRQPARKRLQEFVLSQVQMDGRNGYEPR